MPVYGFAPTSGTTLLVYPSWTTNATTATTSVSWNTWPGLATAGTLGQSMGTLTAAFQQANYAWQSFSYSWPQYPETAAERATRERRRDEAIRQAERRRAARAQVNERAEALLVSLLTPLQAYSYRERGWFEVIGSAGGRFRINKRGQTGNVDELPADGGDRIASYCIHPSEGFPDADAHVAQFLRLVTDEEGFRQVANRTLRRRLPAGMAA